MPTLHAGGSLGKAVLEQWLWQLSLHGPGTLPSLTMTEKNNLLGGQEMPRSHRSAVNAQFSLFLLQGALSWAGETMPSGLFPGRGAWGLLALKGWPGCETPLSFCSWCSVPPPFLFAIPEHGTGSSPSLPATLGMGTQGFGQGHPNCPPPPFYDSSGTYCTLVPEQGKELRTESLVQP